jgi:hypothetical protein
MQDEMNYESYGFWDRFFEWLCYRLSLFFEALEKEKTKK